MRRHTNWVDWPSVARIGVRKTASQRRGGLSRDGVGRTNAGNARPAGTYAIVAGSNFVFRMNHMKMTPPVAANPRRLTFRIG